jgi:hypothetical protein
MSGFIRRIIGKTERMPTINAHVLREPGAAGQEVDKVPRRHADRGMANCLHFSSACALEERMPAETRILLESVARRDVTRTVSEHAAQVTHFFLERRRRRVRIVLGLEQQRMAALRADVFVAAVAIGELLVVVLAEEARQRMPHARERSILGQIIRATAAVAAFAVRLLEGVVVDVMAPKETRQFR